MGKTVDSLQGGDTLILQNQGSLQDSTNDIAKMGEIEMTVKELYEFAKEHGMEDCKIIISNNNDFEVGYDDEITPCAVEDIVVLEV